MAAWAAGPGPAPAAGQATCVSDFISLGRGSPEGRGEGWLSADPGQGWVLTESPHRAQRERAAAGARPAEGAHSAQRASPGRGRNPSPAEARTPAGLQSLPLAPVLSPKDPARPQAAEPLPLLAGTPARESWGEPELGEPGDHRVQCLRLCGREPGTGRVERAWGAAAVELRPEDLASVPQTGPLGWRRCL